MIERQPEGELSLTLAEMGVARMAAHYLIDYLKDLPLNELARIAKTRSNMVADMPADLALPKGFLMKMAKPVARSIVAASGPAMYEVVRRHIMQALPEHGALLGLVPDWYHHQMNQLKPRILTLLGG